MSATLTVATAPPVRSIPWRRLGWVAWRRYRPALVLTGALLAIVALYLLLRGHQMRTAYAAVQACRPAASAACRFGYTSFHDSYGNPGFAAGTLMFVPAVLGAFTGGPLLARELETGTFRFAWTQGVGRMRWLVALLVSGVLGVVVVSAAFGALVAWYAQPLVGSGIQPRLHTAVFPLTGIAVVGWALLAYAAGVLAGLLIRRSVPAIGTTLALWTGVAFLASALREHYQAPLATSTLRLAPQDLPVGQWWSHGGVRVGTAQVNRVLQAIGVQSANGGGDFQVGPGGGTIDPTQYLLQHGYTQWTSYQPDSRYWTFQLIEAGWLIALALIALAATVWLIRRRGA